MIDGGYAFPVSEENYISGGSTGMSLRDWFATHAPNPTEQEIIAEQQADKQANVYFSYQKIARTRLEIISDYKFEYADAMLRARVRGNK